MFVKIASFFGFEKIFTYMSRRNDQMYRQEEIDKKLEPLEYQCPQIMIDFFKLQRRINRENSHNTYSANLILNFGMLDEIMENVDKMDNTILKIMETGGRRSQCRQIQKLINDENKKSSE